MIHNYHFICTSWFVHIANPILNNISEDVRAKKTTARFSIRGPLNFPPASIMSRRMSSNVKITAKI